MILKNKKISLVRVWNELFKIETALPPVNMKLRIIVTLIAILLALIQSSEQQEPDCDCDYHLGGCAISQAPPKGNKYDENVLEYIGHYNAVQYKKYDDTSYTIEIGK